ncbi:MAG TPA: tetratricopeptide repeat protein [Caulobacteraceae bacterium]|jgi:tetratricopeptide (TPR) repeat protein|nr:tetratricopeptide repeat protein [Caulobacteraceae bacterium]
MHLRYAARQPGWRVTLKGADLTGASLTRRARSALGGFLALAMLALWILAPAARAQAPAAAAASLPAASCFDAVWVGRRADLAPGAPGEWPGAPGQRKLQASHYIERADVHADCADHYRSNGDPAPAVVEYDNAINDYRTGIDGDPEPPAYHWSLGRAILLKGLSTRQYRNCWASPEPFAEAAAEIDKAVATLDSDKALKGESYQLYADLGSSDLCHADFAAAEQNLQRALDLYAQMQNVDQSTFRCLYLTRLGQAHLQLGKAAAAVTDFDAAVQARPGCQDIFYWQSMAQLQLKQPDAAIDLVNRELKTSRGYGPGQMAMLLTGLGRAYELRNQAGDVRAARVAFKDALSRDPTLAEAQDHLARLPAPTSAPALPPLNIEAMDDVDHKPLPKMCSAELRNAFLDSINNQIAPAYTRNVLLLNAYVDTLNKLMSKYDSDDTLEYQDKMSYRRQIEEARERAVALSNTIADHEKIIIGDFFRQVASSPTGHC